MTAKDMLLEIGTEELPARFVPDALEMLKSLAEERLGSVGLSFKNAQVFGGPRRLALLVSGLAGKGEEKVRESLGPGVSQSKDQEGNWTPAAQGFARSQGVALDQLEVRDTNRGPRLCAVRRIEGVYADKILPELLPGLIRALSFPKTMVWEDTRFPFARPIRWIVALYGPGIVKFEIAGVKSNRKTWGLTLQSDKPLDISAPARYVPLLRNRCVIVDPKERLERIEKQILQTTKSVKGHVDLEESSGLMEEVVHLVEHPVALLGQFDSKYLSLPAEVLITSMKKHQKFFPVVSHSSSSDSHEEKNNSALGSPAKGRGTLLPCFVGIRHGISENQGVVREGYERVLSARLSDAAFFFEQDQKCRLEDRVPSLEGIVFLQPLNLFHKTTRVRKLAKQISSFIELPEDAMEEVDRMALLSKADLVTNMVGEFPELQGVMGRLYAEGSEKPVVAQGLEQHYWPLTADGQLPESTQASVVSVADKIDSLAGNFLMGNVPTGSQDPYGLRRAAAGVVRIIRERKWRLSLSTVLEFALSPESFPMSSAALQEKTGPVLMDFLKQRWTVLMENQGYRFDEVQAVSFCLNDLVDAEDRLKGLHDIRQHPDFEPLTVSFKRANNIVLQAKQKKIDYSQGWGQEDNIKEAAHASLLSAVKNSEREMLGILTSGRPYLDAFQCLVRLRSPIDDFFQHVMIMVSDEKERAQRLALMDDIVSLFRKIADLSCLQ